MAGMCSSWCWFLANIGVHQVTVAPPVSLMGVHYITYNVVPSHPFHKVRSTTLRPAQIPLIPLSSITGVKGLILQV